MDSINWKKYIDTFARMSLTECTRGISVSDWANIAFRMEALETKKTVFEFGYDGAVEKEQYKDFLLAVKKLKESFHMVESAETTVPKWKRGKKQDSNQIEFKSTFVSDDAYVTLSFDGKESAVGVKAFDRDKALKIIDLFSPILKKKKERQGRACTLLKDQTIYVSDLGEAGKPFVRGNYDPSIVEDYDFLVKDLAAANPYGRLTILDGEAGTGKTYFVRGLINDVENSIFLIVPSTLVSNISDPSFMPAIIDLHEEEEAPIILVLEDADVALLPRSVDNMSKISDLLNFSDGIVGSIIDFRIVATTNAKRMEIEPALVRKGRLSRHINISSLNKPHAISVYERISGKSFSQLNEKTQQTFEDGLILADIYDIASSGRKESAPVPTKKIGL